MKDRYSKFSARFLGQTGTKLLMDDLGEVSADPRYINLGGGNPALIPEMTCLFRDSMLELVDSGEFDKLISTYESPQGNDLFIQAVQEFLGSTLGWNVSEGNIAITNGSQSSFFTLFNLFSGLCVDGVNRSILLPMTPEYISYGDLLACENSLVSHLPKISEIDDTYFKYSIKFEDLSMSSETGAVCVSRPSNPSGNVITDDEMGKLIELTETHEVPLIIDSAYGQPFPEIIFKDVSLPFSKRAIYCFSLSKLGLAGLRTGIVVADKHIIDAVKSINAVTSLSVNAVGSLLVFKLIKSQTISALSRDVVKPFYQARLMATLELCGHYFRDLNVRIHQPDGAFFLWLWIPDLPIASGELYQRIKARGVLVIPGNYFFPGVPDSWQHKNQCLRLSYAQDVESIERGLQVISQEIRTALKC
jgi:valine--pyruvate aminotransferase